VARLEHFFNVRHTETVLRYISVSNLQHCRLGIIKQVTVVLKDAAKLLSCGVELTADIVSCFPTR
jgi:hypothetical protein